MHAGQLMKIKGEPGIWKIRSIQQAVGTHVQEAALDRVNHENGRKFMLVLVADLTPYPLLADCPES